MGYVGDHAAIRLVIYIMRKTGKKARWIWNLFFGILLVFWIAFYVYSSSQILGGLVTYKTNQRYERYEYNSLYTDIGVYEIETDHVEIDISQLLKYAQPGDSLQLVVSKITGELMEIRCDGNILYKIPVIPSAIWVQQPLCLLLMGGLVFMIIVVNIKKPKGYLKKIQQDMNIS